MAPAAVPANSASTPRWTAVDDYLITQDVEYVSRPTSARQRLDLYLPKGPKRGPLPLLVWIHGGGWAGGDKVNCPAMRMLKDGFAVASLNYRLTSEAKWPAQIYDCKAAIRWLRAHGSAYGIDPSRIAVWGASAGGHLAALLGTSSGRKNLEGDLGNNSVSSDVQAVVDWCGPSDFLPNDQPIALPAGSMDMVVRLFGGPLQQHKEEAVAASPVTYITGKEPPFLIMHGKQDDVVPLQQATELTERLKAKNDPVQLMIVPDAGHHLLTDRTEQVVREFLKRNFKLP